MLGKPGGVFFLMADNMSADEAVLLAAAARAVLGGGRGSLTDQIELAMAPRSLDRRHSLRTGRDSRCRRARPTA